jgi:purine-binding chemotaxis protein CheW
MMMSNALVNLQRKAVAVQAIVQEPSQYLTYTLGAEMFAIGILHIKEIIEYGALTAVPMMPGFIRGVINLRGAVVPVIDLASRFGGQPTETTRRTCIVIVELRLPEGETRVLGVVVDTVSAVLDIAASDIEPAPAFGTRIRTDFIAGMAKVGGKFVILLDVDRVLSMDEMTTLSAVVGADA